MITREWLIQWLDTRFGHPDYWQLNKQWKHVRFGDVADEILLMIAGPTLPVVSDTARLAQRSIAESVEKYAQAHWPDNAIFVRRIMAYRVISRHTASLKECQDFVTRAFSESGNGYVL